MFVPKSIYTALLLSSATLTRAVNIVAFPTRSCSGNAVRSCINLPPATCCTFPVGGLLAQAVIFTLLQECDIGIWYYPNGNNQCATARETAAGPLDYVCMTGGNTVPGGGGAWFNLCNRQAAGLLDAGDATAVAAEIGDCTQQQLASIYAYPEDEPGVYVLTPTQEQYDAISLLPPATTPQEEVDVLKAFDATYYADITSIPGYDQLAEYYS